LEALPDAQAEGVRVIRFVSVGIGSGGSVSCARCSPERQEPSYRPLDEVLVDVRRVCETWGAGTGPNIVLNGAEPFAHPDLPRIVSGAVEAGCSRLAVDTDAIGLRSAANATGAVVAGVRHVRFTLLAGTEGVHDALCGAPGSLDATRAGIRSFRAAADAQGLDVSVTARVPVCRHNANDLPASVAAAVECGADRVEVRVTDGGMELAAAVPWITAACDTGVVNGVWVQVDGVPFCLLPGYDLHLADAVRSRDGSKQPVCGDCALNPVCGGAPAGASTDQLATLSPPVFAETLAPQVAHARATEVR
jgi:MoaA/NifB/PqqE/SkfB family radical SAM enzyme